jgi:ATP-dependent DNA helicase RecG
MSEPLSLDDPLERIDPRIAGRRFRAKGPAADAVLAETFGIESVGALLRHYPRRYIDRSSTAPIRAIQAAVRPAKQPRLAVVEGEAETRERQVRLGQEVTVIGTVHRVDSRRTRRGQPMVTVVVSDGSGRLELPYFNQPWIAKQLRPGMEVAVSGRIGLYRGRLQLQNQQVEPLRGEEADTVHTGRIIPVHPATDGVTARTIRELVFRALQRLPRIDDPVPADVLAGEELADEDTALRGIHFPAGPRELRAATDRLKFDELLLLELAVAFRKRRLERHAAGVAHELGADLAESFIRALPFELTEAQRRVMKEISVDMSEPRPMHRLLQGDVGSGKTAVAVYAALVAVQSGHQGTIMAPTEVLAGQHFRNVEAMLAPIGGRNVAAARPEAARGRGQVAGQRDLFAGGDDEPVGADAPAPSDGPRYGLLTGSVTGKERERVLAAIRDGEVDVVIGTHALVQEGVTFGDLSLAVVDEQHRFGLHQRVLLKQKGASPDVLIMTATPIPRTLALTYYGDLDVSTLDELPAGRRPIETYLARTDAERAEAYDLVRTEAKAGRQTFVVCAAIDESNKTEVRSAEAEADRLATEVFPDLRISLLHGRMRPTEKETNMRAFAAGESDVLIATTVVEVGVDVPNATVMLVENADRFGLAQLHQLRGRIGRGEHRSWCVLFDESDEENLDARARLAAMARTTDGFELADEDLRLRGEGTLFDVRQSGMPDLKLARLADDVDLVKRARARAFAVVDADEELSGHPELLALMRSTFSGDAAEWLFHG